MIAFLGLLVGAGVIGGFVLSNPRYRARLAYREGLRRQLSSDFAGARDKYEVSLRYDPTFGLAAFSMGTTYLRLGDPAIIQSVDALVQEAVKGYTADLDAADRWFRHSITIGDQLPPQTRLMDQRIGTPRQLRSYARACLALTALIRASAALQADQLDDGLAWLREAGQEANRALLEDPQNSAADRILRNVTPHL